MTMARLPEDLEARRLLFKHALQGVEELERAAVDAATELRAVQKAVAKQLDALTAQLERAEALVETCTRIRTDFRPQLAAIRRAQDLAFTELAEARGEDVADQGVLL